MKDRTKRILHSHMHQETALSRHQKERIPSRHLSEPIGSTSRTGSTNPTTLSVCQATDRPPRSARGVEEVPSGIYGSTLSGQQFAGKGDYPFIRPERHCKSDNRSEIICFSQGNSLQIFPHIVPIITLIRASYGVPLQRRIMHCQTTSIS